MSGKNHIRGDLAERRQLDGIGVLAKPLEGTALQNGKRLTSKLFRGNGTTKRAFAVIPLSEVFADVTKKLLTFLSDPKDIGQKMRGRELRRVEPRSMGSPFIVDLLQPERERAMQPFCVAIRHTSKSLSY